MQENTHINIGSHFDGFVTQMISAGRFTSKSEVVRAALRLLEERETQLSVLRSALIEGENSGICENYSLQGLLEELDNECSA
jgi:antitoxin ParD1/3/4